VDGAEEEGSLPKYIRIEAVIGRESVTEIGVEC
jgi:hypothetical protein